MRVIPTGLPEVKIIAPTVFEDQRGVFYESHNARKFSELIGRDVSFVQDNHSRSHRGVLRGLHYQVRQPQGKLIGVTAGEIFDVAVDLRRSSPNFGKWTGAYLSDQNRHQLWVPEGFAHGFIVVSDWADVLYKTTDYWAPEHERAIVWNDPELAIAWPDVGEVLLAAKDSGAPLLKTADLFD